MDIMEMYSSLSPLSSPHLSSDWLAKGGHSKNLVSLLAARSAEEPPFQEATKENVEGEEPLI